jgi:hypothetical protein
MNIDYKEKYLKYKIKYLELKDFIEQNGSGKRMEELRNRSYIVSKISPPKVDPYYNEKKQYIDYFKNTKPEGNTLINFLEKNNFNLMDREFLALITYAMNETDYVRLKNEIQFILDRGQATATELQKGLLKEYSKALSANAKSPNKNNYQNIKTETTKLVFDYLNTIKRKPIKKF